MQMFTLLDVYGEEKLENDATIYSAILHIGQHKARKAAYKLKIS